MSETILTCKITDYPLREAFTISRGSKTSAAVLQCFIRNGNATGKGECVPYPRYGETLQTVKKQIAAIKPLLEKGAGHADVIANMKPGAARNAVDCALWDLRAKMEKTSVAALLAIRPEPLITAFTLSLADPGTMHRQARENAARPLLKIKVGGKDDIARMKAVREGAPRARLIVDANEGWNKKNLLENMQAARDCGVSLIEQPLPADNDSSLAAIARPVPVCADESAHTCKDIARLTGLYDAINIKLDKTGGLTEALRMKKQAQQQGFQIMIGCMVASSLAMAPAILLAQDADYVDLDGPLLLKQDCPHGLHYDQSHIFPPAPQLWG